MSDVEKVARALCRYTWQYDIPPGRLDAFVEQNWRDSIDAAEAALAAMGEREAVADDRLAPVREDVIRMRLEQLFADKPVDQWGSIGLAEALSANVEALVAAAVSNERLRVASPRPEAVEEAVTMAEIEAARRALHDMLWPDKEPTEHTWTLPISVAAIRNMLAAAKAAAIRSTAEPPAPTPLTPSIPDRR